MDSFLSFLLVAVAGAAGAIARFWLSGMIGRRIGETFPWGTLAVNVTGAAAIGLLAGALPSPIEGSSAPVLRLALITGFLGSYTTVSSFSLQTMNLARLGEWPKAAGNIAASITLCLGAAAAGFAASAALARA